MSNSEDVKAFVRRRKNNLIKVFNSKCSLCGWDGYQEGLEFHHVHPEEKEFGIGGNNAVTKALEKQLAEMRKCILVCANCHRGIHYGYIEVPVNWQSFFNEDVAKQLLEELDKTKHGEIFYCKDCGAHITRGATRCVTCSQKAQQRVTRPTRNELKVLVRTLPFTTIGARYGVSDNAVRKWCDAENLPRKATEIKKYTDEEWELL